MRRILWLFILLLLVLLGSVQVVRFLPSQYRLTRQTVTKPKVPLPTLATSNLMTTARITFSGNGKWLAVLHRGYREISQGRRRSQASLTTAVGSGDREDSISFRQAYFRLAASITREGYPFVRYALSPDKKMLATFGGDDRRVAVWDTGSGRLLAVWKEHSSPVTEVLLSSDGKLVVTGTEGGGAYVWSVERGELLRRVRLHRGKVTALAITADGSLLATAGEDAVLKVWRLQTGRLLWRSHRLRKPIVALAFSPDGEDLLSSTEDGESALWESASGKERERIEWRFGVTGRVRSVGFSEDGEEIQISYEQEYICLWNLGESRLQGVIQDLEAPVYSMTFTPDGKYLFVGDEIGNVYIWHTENMERESVIPICHAPVTALANSPDSKHLLVGTADGKVEMWNWIEKRKMPWRLAPYVGRVQYVAFTGDGQRFVSATADGEVVVRNMRGAEMARANCHGELQVAALSSDGRLLATQRSEGFAVWELAGQYIQPVAEANSLVPADTLGFSPDNSRLYAVGRGGVDTYRIADGRLQFASRLAERFAFYSALSPDGNIIANGCNGTVVELTSLHDGRMIARLEYAGSDAGWLIASGDGYYTCSEEAKSHVAWDIGNEVERTMGRDPLAYYRPESVHLALKTVYETR